MSLTFSAATRVSEANPGGVPPSLERSWQVARPPASQGMWGRFIPPIDGDFEDGLLGLPHYYGCYVLLACQGLGSDTLRYVCQFSGHFSSLSIWFPS